MEKKLSIERFFILQGKLTAHDIRQTIKCYLITINDLNGLINNTLKQSLLALISRFLKKCHERKFER